MSGPQVHTFHDVGITVISSWIFNCYVVHDGGDGRPFVVDVGMVRNSEAVLKHLRRLGGAAAAATEQAATSEGDGSSESAWVVAATHTHSDHVAGVPHLDAHADIDLRLPAVVESWSEGEKPPVPGLKAMSRITPVLRDQPFDFASLRGFVTQGKLAGYGARPYRMPVTPAGYVADGEPVPGASNWVALHTPGHSVDSTSYWCESTRTLLSGDAVLSVGGKGWFNPEYTDEALSADTEEKLRKLHVDVLLVGHGRPCVGDDLLGSALGHLEKPHGDQSGLRRFFRRHRGA